MRRSLLLYLFVFTALIVVFQYVTSRRMLESKNEEIVQLNQELEQLRTQADSLPAPAPTTEKYNFETNDQAMTYFEERGIEASEVVSMIEEGILSRNKVSEDNELVPYEGMEGPMRINSYRILNHKWILADFTDGTYWGELFISYYLDDDRMLHLKTENALLYSGH